MVCLAYYVLYLARFRWQWVGAPVTEPATLAMPMLSIAAFWLLLFLLSGLYRERFAESRLDELASILKVATVGILVLFFALFIFTLDPGSAHVYIGVYWLAVVVLVSVGRMGFRWAQKLMLLRGYGTRRALIVGWDERVNQLYQDVARYPQAGLDVVGVLRVREGKTCSVSPEPVGGNGPEFDNNHMLLEKAWNGASDGVENLPRLIEDLEVQDVLLAFGAEGRDDLMDVLRVCDGLPVRLKLVPDLYHVIAGMARTEHMYGLPLIEVLPIPMPFWEQVTKRLMDVMVSLLVLGIGLPAWLLVAVLIRVTSRGPVVYKQQRVGRHGTRFVMYKFRTMEENAESETGPVWATEDDPRYTGTGRWLRRKRVDEVPQFINVLKGDMSLVGPRPERPYFVERLSKEIPLYGRRHRVKPGITGLAQVKWKYDESLEDVRQKVKYDLFYIENMSLRMDYKILFQTLRATLLGNGR